MINKTITKTWLFQSKSNPSAKPHETRQYIDGTTSCNCAGWCKHTDDAGNRTCPHVRMVESGTADAKCVQHLAAEPVATEQSEVQTVTTKPKLVLRWKPVITSNRDLKSA